ncbi:MAG TPA: 2-succinyl-5-enolpyruvyl-6-hydroxy-3-cyclohexene-1-carboxylic-acid synthase [Marmoricola sp.]|nr:2-succinyl-5-enolpyruvyl-6-hydroxy-3-cyclohexene-1-carboxylic-acid synthase [Marmoricola sp.]
MTPATELARAVVDALLRAGVRHVVLAPGSRNAPLSFALYDAATAGALTLHTRIDERTGAFLALGIAKTSRRPAAVVTTSGTAAANLHPAILEAAHSGIPLVAVTADRPARLRGTIANQTTEQAGLFGSAVSSQSDVVAAADITPGLAGLPDGPVHLNVQLDDPLVGERPAPARAPEDSVTYGGDAAVLGTLASGPRTVVVAGDDAGPAIRVLAEHARWPLLAEPTSGSRNGEAVIRCYRLLLGTALADRVERVVVAGSPTLSRPVQRLLSRTDVEVVSVRTKGRWPDRPHPVRHEYDEVQVHGQDDPAWFQEWRDADRSLSERLDALVAAEPGLTPYDVAAAVNAAVPAGGLLHVGASNPIRDLDLMARPYPVGERRLLIANRGLAGIDGTLSTAIGAVLGRPHTTRALAYVGDVTFLHDLTGLVIGPGEQRPDLTIVVANDDGGSIFATLEQGAPEHGEAFDKLFGTPHGVDLATVCTGLKVPHWRVHDRSELEHALANPNGGIEVVEAVVRRDNRRALDEQIRALATGL